MEIDTAANPIIESVNRAHMAFKELGTLKGADRSRGVKAMAKGLKNAFETILEANTLDLEMSREMAVPELILDWLKLTPERLQTTVEILQQLAELSDPIEKVINAPYQLHSSQTYCQLQPLGTVALIYEAFPELAAIAAGLCIKTGNTLILRGSSEASYSNMAIATTLQTALEGAGLPTGCLEILPSDRGASIQDLVKQDRYLSLVIPYGRSSLVQQVTELATAPVLRTVMGNCYLYWSISGDLDLARWMIIDSRASQPDPVNAIEKVLINSYQKPSSMVRLFSSLHDKGFQLRGDRELVKEFPEYLVPIGESEWGKPYLNKIVAFKLVDNIEAAIAWINKYSSGHADCLITESYKESHQFAMEINSALVYINSSPRFYRNPKRGESVFLGMSNQKGFRGGGLIGLETFTTIKQVVQGDGKY
jgi:glutamate-5-semialdehyde dehydrogenase